MMMLIAGVYISPWFSLLFTKGEVKLVELVAGMGVFLRADKVSHAMEKSKESPTRLLRILMDMFFEPEIMARSTAKGSQRRGLEALDQTIMESLYSK